MGWFKQSINNIVYQSILHKKASTEEVKNKALSDLQNPEANTAAIANEFIMGIHSQDPAFAYTKLMIDITRSRGNRDALIAAISSYGGDQPVSPTGFVPTTPTTPTTPIITTPPFDEVKPPVEEIIDPEAIEPKIDDPEVLEQDADVEDIILKEEDIDAEDAPLAPEGQEGFQSFEERLQQDNENLREDEGEDSVYKNPTILKSFNMPVSNMVNVAKGLAKINKRLKHIHHPPIRMRYEGDAYSKPVYYKDGTSVDEEFAKVEISGRLPSPTDEIGIKKQNLRFWQRNTKGHKIGDPMMEPDGRTQKTTKPTQEPKGVKIFARINHHALKPEEVDMYLKTEPADSKLRASIEGALANHQSPWYNTITPIGKRYQWDDRFYFSKSKECYKCKNRRERNFTYIAAIVPPGQLINQTYKGVDESGNMVDLPIMIERDENYGRAGTKPKWKEVNAREVPEELLKDMGNVQQEQLGGNCAATYTEIAIMKELEREIAKWELTSQQVEENNSENAKEGKAPKERQNKPGGTRGNVPSEAFFTTAIALLREYGIDGDIRGRLPFAASNYVDLIELQNQNIPKDLEPQIRERRERQKERYVKRKTELIPKITLDDQRIASEAINWWRQRLNSFGNEGDDNNKVSLSILQTIDISKRNKTKYNQFGYNPNLKSAVEMMQTYLAENSIPLEPHPEEVQTETGAEDIAPEQEILDNMKEVGKGDTFVSKFKHISSTPYAGGHGLLHYFRGDDGKKYKIFDSFKKDPTTQELIREPQYNFDEEEEYTLRGNKGRWSGGSTALSNVSIVSPERLVDHVGADEAPVVEAPVVEAPIDEAPIDEGIGIPPEGEGIGVPPEEAPKPKMSVKDVTQRAKYVIESGRDSRGDPMSVETLIPLYLNQLGTRVRGFEGRKQSYEQKLNQIHQRGGPEALAKYMDTLGDYFKDYEI